MQKDIKEKKLKEHNDVFADIFNNLLFAGKTILKKEDLITLPTESYVRAVDGKLHEEQKLAPVVTAVLYWGKLNA